MDFSITKEGKKLKKSLYTWDEKVRVLSTNEGNLVLDFSDIDRVTFKTGSICIFKTGHNCVFNTGFGCIFKTGDSCNFRTGSNCTFNTGSNCTFDTGSNCTFDTDGRCTFDTSSDCTFDVSFNCTFKTDHSCIFKAGGGCTFKTGHNCVIIRRDVSEVIKIPEDVEIRLNSYKTSGYVVQPKREIVEIEGRRYYKDEVQERLRELRPVIY